MQTFKIGYCGDAWKLRVVGEEIDVFDHRPYAANGEKTPVGICADFQALILYPERGKIDWEKELGQKLTDGHLFSGASIKVIYLEDEIWRKLLKRRKEITLDELKELARKSDEVFIKMLNERTKGA